MKKAVVVFIFFIIYSFNLNAQVNLKASAAFNYWEHTDLVGPGIGIGVEYRKNKWNYSLDYAFGYGTYNRLNNFDNINYDYWTTVLVDEDKWTTDLGAVNAINKLKAKTDYGKEHQILFTINRNLFERKNKILYVGLGGYASIVEHFFTFTNIEVYDLKIIPFYQGPLNYIPVSHQKFLTYGFNFKTSLDIKIDRKIWSPFLAVGIGPKFGNYCSIGVSLKTAVRRKKN